MSLKGVLRVALLAGGISSEREVSLKGAKAVEKALKTLGYKVKFFDVPVDLPKLVKERKEFDCAFLVLHGKGGEDGTIQGFLDSIGLPYQGADVLGSALAMHKGISKTLYKLAGLNVPEGKCFFKEQISQLKEYAKFLKTPLVIKPATQGSSFGLSILENLKDLDDALTKAFNYDEEVLIEKFIKGREITVGILGNEVLPVVEIIPKKAKFFDYETKYTPGLAEEICPANLPEEVYKQAQEYAKSAHRILRLRHYSRTDMIVKEKEIFVLETNTIPGMTETSLLPLSAKVAGYSFEKLIDKLLKMTLNKTE